MIEELRQKASANEKVSMTTTRLSTNLFRRTFMQKLRETESQVNKAQNKVKKSEDVSPCVIDVHDVHEPLLRPSILSKRMFSAKFAWSCYSNHMRESAFSHIDGNHS